MNFVNISFMDKKFTSNNIGNEEFTFNTEKNDYRNLIIRLQEMNKIIVLLEKRYLDKF